MLYVNERIRMWNPETDQLDGRDEYEEKELGRIVEEGQALDALKRTPGWEVLEELLKTTCSDLKEKLAYEQDIEKFRRLQEAVKAYQNVLTFVDYKIAEGKALEEKQQAPIEG
jgi:hypothetical protein